MSTSPEQYHYLSLTSQPPITDELTIKLAVQDALTATFGLVYAGTPIDVVSLALRDEGEDVIVVRVALECVDSHAVSLRKADHLTVLV